MMHELYWRTLFAWFIAALAWISPSYGFAGDLDPAACNPKDVEEALASGTEGKELGNCLVEWESRRAGELAALPETLEADSDTDVTHYFLDLEVIPETTGSVVTAVRVEGVSTIDFEPTTNGLTTFTVDLHSSLTVNQVTGDVASWARVGDTIEVTLDDAYDVGEAVQVVVDYEGYPQDNGFGSFRWWIRNGEVVIATLSEPFFARYWWACKDALDDKATAEIFITVPSNLIALSNGSDLGTVALPGSRTQYRWQESYLIIPYLISIAITDYERYDLQYSYDNGGGPEVMPVSCYVYPDHWDSGAGEPFASYKSGCDEMVGMLETLSGLYGEYPFVDEKYGVVETGGSGGLSASMEHQTLSSMWRLNSYSDIMAHEMAHQWWGDDVTCETWYDIWLNEGFATYSESMYREFKTGGGASSYWTRMNVRHPSNTDAQVYRTSVSSVGAIFSGNDVYNKGAWVLHMLRHVLGDTAFFAALSDYRATYGADSATTAEFAATISASVGEDISWFIDQWVMNPGSPDYEWNYSADNIGGQDYLKLAIWQTQDGDGWDLFTMPIDIRVTTGSGTSVFTVWNDDWEEFFVIPVDGPILDVEFDEEGGVSDRNWVLWDSRAKVATAVESPPVLVSADIAFFPTPENDLQIALTFSEDVGSFDAADLQLSGVGIGTIAPASVSYDAGSHVAIVTILDLPPDQYVLTVFSDDVTANGKNLDGDRVASGWWEEGELPTGNGSPGGDVLLSFNAPATPVPSVSTEGLVMLGVLLLMATRGAGSMHKRR
ncbi:MAG: M1 family metallopeptidase [bacterium]|nr:M1 family metallopeptidase [bacterium]